MGADKSLTRLAMHAKIDDEDWKRIILSLSGIAHTKEYIHHESDVRAILDKHKLSPKYLEGWYEENKQWIEYQSESQQHHPSV
jgi:predicted ATP-dependent protease